MRIAISGCGVAGPALAFWLRRYGYEPVLIEKAEAPRDGGYIIDFWGSGFEVAERMGVVPKLRERSYRIDRLRTARRDGSIAIDLSTAPFYELTGDRYLSIARSDVARTLLEACDGVEMRFGTSITEIEQSDDGAFVTFESGDRERFDLVIGADGLHSNVRKLAFGPHRDFQRPLGLHVAAFTASGYRPRDEGAYLTYTRPNRQIARAALRDDRTLFLLVFNDRLVSGDAMAPGTHKRALREVFGGMGWEADMILSRLDEADDLYFDSVSQVQMPAWSRGRVALLGDAAACISLLGGEGTGLAMTEAYVLAGELANAGGDYTAAFASYEKMLRPLLAKKQAGARQFTSYFAPKGWIELVMRNLMLRATALPIVGKRLVESSFSDDFALPDYPEPGLATSAPLR